MALIENVVNINCSPEEVFDARANPRNECVEGYDRVKATRWEDRSHHVALDEGGIRPEPHKTGG